MKLIIDMPNEVYDWNVNGFPDEEDAIHLLDIVKNGTPLEESDDCVSRQALVEKAINWKTRFTYSKRYVSLTDILTLPPVIPKRSFEGMTNGEVIKVLFPNGKVIERDEAVGYEQMLDDKYSYCSWFDGLWWNAPYKGGEQNEVSD